MITKRTYIKAAKIVNDIRDGKRFISQPRSGQAQYLESVAIEVENAFVNLFEGDNPRFDKKKFLDACKADSED